MLQKQFFVTAIQIGKHFRISTGIRRHRIHCRFELKSPRANNLLQKLAQCIRGGLPV